MEPKQPLITKEEFVSVLNFMQSQDAKFDSLCETLEGLAPGFRVDFLPNLSYNEQIIKLLNILVCSPEQDSLIDYFIYELDWGRYEKSNTALMFRGEPIDLSTPEKLYDAIVKVYFLDRYHYEEIMRLHDRFTDIFNDDREEDKYM